MNHLDKKEIIKRVLKGESIGSLIELPIFPKDGDPPKFNEVEPGVFVDIETGAELNESKDRYTIRTKNFDDAGLPLPEPKTGYYIPKRL